MDNKTANGRGGWKQDPAGVRKNILAVAMAEFAANGLAGARIDEIAAKTDTSKRMIYYYFGDKERLYGKVLEEAYREVRAGEEDLELDHLSPVAALTRLAEFTFDHHSRHPDFIRMVMIENIHNGQYLARSEQIRLLNAGAVQNLEAICRRGRELGLFRDDVAPLELHWHISAMSFFNVSNRATFSRIFGDTLFKASGQRFLKEHMVEMVVGLALKPDNHGRR
ncbi:TetR/AcrR family transcriptional regulator [Mesorhizobium sp.]|uniref:TetR/AcrR family transcriptional regulator n=1 Tax=Mesorhizobium sp. TaxID=1871066 RepID=UPI000FE97A8E|nr:TetR/AcrR family transcriptional regulator [Mesorhizobium sp.]RWD73598.1 MAG: TetR/AcrR family transcriptional regulator [Mesorhizobium sp.]RWE79121.1 MAG: TetR/AcrR family transcriptional regulator [Mesorhizobium sp.]TIV61488.1 MAG: TetR/AcrR family transcriptional regulator [Mesorhizobium sp.]TIW26411.1 MAG: TetR/AcrR family transcriptional regulator [Mesorhizobium sp.]